MPKAKPIKAKNCQDVIRLLYGKSSRTIGKGMFSRVYNHPTDKNLVLKFVSDADYIYLNFVRWAKKHQDNPYLPRIKEVIPVEVFGAVEEAQRTLFSNLVVLEKLQRCTALQELLICSEWSESDDSELYYISSSGNKTFKSIARKSLDKHLAKVCRYISERPDNEDVHRGNIMLRGSQYVFTDPLAP